VQRDTSSYYLIGYSSTNTLRDGRFRRISVRVKRNDLRVEARSGYYADRDFAHTGPAGSRAAARGTNHRTCVGNLICRSSYRQAFSGSRRIAITSRYR
jgi:hypothetical protein